MMNQWAGTDIHPPIAINRKLFMENRILSHKRLLEVLDYNPKTGIFTWKERLSHRIYIGDKAGCKRIDGYYIISIEGKRYYNHQLAWYYIYKEWLDVDIDHKDRDTSNNSIKNLRPATRRINSGHEFTARESNQCQFRNTG
mgnify:CR=1 FL=1